MKIARIKNLIKTMAYNDFSAYSAAGGFKLPHPID
jgi:hypothetical protein